MPVPAVPEMVAGSRRESDRIALTCIGSAGSWSARLADLAPGGATQRAIAMAEALDFLAGCESPSPRTVGLPVMTLARHAAATLADDIGGDPFVATEAFEAACHLHDELDAVVTALGGAPELIVQDDDWGPEPCQEDTLVLCSGLSDTAGTAAMFARDAFSHVASVAGTGATLMRRDAGIAVAASLVLRSALSDTAGTPARLVRPVAAMAAEALSRLVESAAGWRGIEAPGLPGRLLDDLGHVGDATRALIAEIEAEISPSPV